MTVLEDLLSPKAKEELQLNRLRELARQNKMQELLDPVLWIEKNFYIPELMGPLELQPYQKAVLRESQRKDDSGKFVYSIVVWSDIKKSAKSTIAAAMALYIGHLREWGSIKIVANKLEQADSRVAYYLRRSVELNSRMENIKQVRYLTTLPNHTTIQAIPINPGGEAGGNDDLLIFSEMWAAKHQAMKTMWCYDDQTEILTKDGWIRGVDLGVGDCVATVKPEKHILEWENISNLYRGNYRGEMHLYESRGFSECVTPNHRLYGIFSHNTKDSLYAKTGIMRSDDLRESGYGVYFPLTTINDYQASTCNEIITIPATKFKPEYSLQWGDFCEYMGWYLSEGRVKHNKKASGDYYPVSVYICQDASVHKKEWEKIERLHNKMFGVGNWRLANKNTDFIVDSAPFARFVEKFAGTGTKNKFINRKILDTKKEYLQRFFLAFLDGDGHLMSSGSWEASVGNKTLADQICEVGFKLGWNVSIRIQKPQNKKWNIYWRVRFYPKRSGYDREIVQRHGHWKTINYDGLVWCPSTKNGLLVVRRNGKIYVSGNTEMTLSPTKFGYSQRWVETYAGSVGEASTLEQLYIQGVKTGKQLDLSYTDENGRFHDLKDLEVYANGPLLCLWNTKPRCPWQTQEYYNSEAAVLTPNEFNRVHRNQWTSSTDTFVPPEWWHSCRGNVPELKPKETIVLAMDAGVSDDSFALCGVRKWGVDGVDVVYSRRWLPPQGGKISFTNPDNPNDRETPEGEIRHLCGAYNVVMVAYDPYQLEDMANRLGREGVAWFFAFGQGALRLTADSNLRTLIREKRLRHNGDPDLTEHVLNAGAKTDSEDSRIRIVKRATHLKVDLCVSLSMSADRVLYLLNL